MPKTLCIFLFSKPVCKAYFIAMFYTNAGTLRSIVPPITSDSKPLISELSSISLSRLFLLAEFTSISLSRLFLLAINSGTVSSTWLSVVELS